jgi:peptide/nickel transport system substrate-binding protein
MAKEEGYDYWWQLFAAKGTNTNAWITNPELPVLYPWKLKKLTDSQLVIERNPYYFKERNSSLYYLRTGKKVAIEF